MRDAIRLQRLRWAALLPLAAVALVVSAHPAAAASNPVGRGTTIVTLDPAFAKGLKRAGVRVSKAGLARVTATRWKLPTRGGSLDPLNGKGFVTHHGAIKLKRGKRSVTLASIELSTTARSLLAKVAGMRLKFASIAGLSHARDGFGTDLAVARMKLTGKAARRLNEALEPDQNARIRPAFHAGEAVGRVISSIQPETVAVLPGTFATLATDAATSAKLARVGVEIQALAPATAPAAAPTPAYDFPISGGTLSPYATGGIVRTMGGFKFVQDLEKLGLSGAGTTTMTLANVWIDFGARVATVEAVIENARKPELNRGDQGRSSIVNLSLVGAAVTRDPATRTIDIRSANATLQGIAAEVLNSVFVVPVEAAKGPQERFGPGEVLGTFALMARGR